MFSSNLTKFFLLFALFFSLFSGCNWRQKGTDANLPAAPPVADDLKSEVPFSTREPARFQAEIVVTTGTSERRTFIARNGAQRRYDFNFGAKNQLTTLQTEKNYLLYPARKIYTETVTPPSVPADDWTNFLTTEWLNEKRGASFIKLETGGNPVKYRVTLDDAAEGSEIFVFVDEILGLPVRQEFYTNGGQLTYSVELKNIELETNADLFSIPADFKKTDAEEFRKILRSEE